VKTPILKQLTLILISCITISACAAAENVPATVIPGKSFPTTTIAALETALPTISIPIPTNSIAADPTPTPTQSVLLEAPVQLISIQGEISLPDAEVSGMTWYGDLLLILPQYPENYPSAGGSSSLFAVSKDDILDFIDGSTTAPIETIRIPINNTQVTGQIPGYEGFEAIAVDGEQVYLSIEANDFGTMRGYLIQGSILEGGSAIDLNQTSLVEIPTPVQIFNAAYETLLAKDGQAMALYEANGQDLNPAPQAQTYDPNHDAFTATDFDHIEYRLTDATGINSDGHFWVMNNYMPIEFWFYTRTDPITEMYGLGETHQSNNHVERLLEFKYNDGEISTSGKPPLYLELINDAHSRNWEALVRLDEIGFLAMTDTYPGTILAFIPFPGD